MGVFGVGERGHGIREDEDEDAAEEVEQKGASKWTKADWINKGA